MSEGYINLSNKISASLRMCAHACVFVCNAYNITNGVINFQVRAFFVWLYWNKLLFTDELCAYWYGSINNYWSLWLVKFHQLAPIPTGRYKNNESEREKERKRERESLYSFSEWIIKRNAFLELNCFHVNKDFMWKTFKIKSGLMSY